MLDVCLRKRRHTHEAQEHQDQLGGGGRAADDPALRPSPREGATAVQVRVGEQGVVGALACRAGRNA